MGCLGRTIFLSLVVASLLHSVARADTYTDMLTLAFPQPPSDPGMLPYHNVLKSLGVVKLAQAEKLCVVGPDPSIVAKTNILLDQLIQDFPETVRRYINRDCEAISLQNASAFDGVILVSSSPWGDARLHLLPLVQRLSPDMNAAELIAKYESADKRVMHSVTVQANDRKIISLMALRVKSPDDTEKIDDALLTQLLTVLNPKLAESKPIIQLAAYSGSGQLKLLDFARDFFTLLYSSNVESGASKEQFEESLRSCVNSGACR
jgi:hypothetical protein